jgi:aspartyl-tRNA(Asn)/glutamyl-tRNA(Gln) amidotransferase subunit A
MAGGRVRTSHDRGLTPVMATNDMDGIFLARPDAPADGVRLAVKDLFDTAGLVTTYGSAIFAEHLPAESAPAVRLAEAGGYAVVGKTNLHEFAYGVTSQNPHFGTVPNPRAPGRVAGGSSGGSAAALAAGLADAALGTDSGGSIRIPAACCGVVGLKPTYGLVPLDGCFPLAPSFDHAGPMARTVRECEALLEALVPGFAPRRLESLEEVEIGVAWLEGCAALVRECVAAAADRLPRRRALDLPYERGGHELFMREVADVHRELYAEHADAYGDNVRSKIARCLQVGEADAEADACERTRYAEEFEEAWSSVDLVLTPTLEYVAPPNDVDELTVREAMIRRTYPLNLLGWPALALPCGPAEDGAPASVQLVGRPGDDALVLAAGAALEAALASPV